MYGYCPHCGRTYYPVQYYGYGYYYPVQYYPTYVPVDDTLRTELTRLQREVEELRRKVTRPTTKEGSDGRTEG